MQYVITQYVTETRWTVVEAEDEDAAIALIEDGDDEVGPWIGARFNADYDTSEAQPEHLTAYAAAKETE